MAFKLSRTDIQERDSMVTALRAKLDTLNSAIEEYNVTINDAWDTVENALGDFNGSLSDARDLLERIKDDAQSEYDDKSEKWQEGDRASAVQDWIYSLDITELDDVELDKPETVDGVDCSGLDELENIETEPSY